MIKNQVEDYRPIQDKFIGIYRGVVEDIDDPLQSGRVRIRIYGLHTDTTIQTETEGVPDNELVWAQPALPLIEGAYSGYGLWSIPHVGTHVFLFFENGNHMQPRYFASVPGQGDWPTDSYPNLIRLATSSGHIIEIDNTSGSEQIRVHHTAGTYFTIDKDGKLTINIVDNEEATINGNVNINVGGNASVRATGNIDIEGSTINLNSA